MSKEIEDFGFSFEDEKQDKTYEHQKRVSEKEKVFREYHDTVIKFLTKLASKPEKTMIKWPNRAVEIKSLMEALNVIYAKKNEVDIDDE